MKKLMILGILLLLSSVGLKAQDKDQDQDRTRLMMVDGSLLQIRDQDQVQLKDKVTLNDGTVLNANGRYVTRDGDRMRLRDGECLDGDGIKYNSEYQYRYKIMQENKGLSQEQMRERNQNRVHYVAMDGNVYRVNTAAQNRVQQQLKMGNGMTMNPDGTYRDMNQNQMRLRDGECLNMNGQKFQNMLQQRKMMMQRQQMVNKNMNMNKKNMQKKSMNKRGGKS